MLAQSNCFNCLLFSYENQKQFNSYPWDCLQIGIDSMLGNKGCPNLRTKMAGEEVRLYYKQISENHSFIVML